MLRALNRSHCPAAAAAVSAQAAHTHTQHSSTFARSQNVCKQASEPSTRRFASALELQNAHTRADRWKAVALSPGTHPPAAMEVQLAMDGAVAAAAGGVVLGTATMLKLAVNGNILGISGIVNGVCGNLVSRDSSPWYWRIVFASGFVGAGAVLRAAAPATLQALPQSMSWARVICAGALVGFGTSMGNGCTSGHGISGLTRVSARSAVATAVFMTSAALTASLTAASDFFAATTDASPAVTARDAVVASLVLIAALGCFAAAIYAVVSPATATSAAKNPDHPARLATELVAASCFGLALGISGMGRPQQVIAFLDVHHAVWDPTLAFVMGAALCVTTPLYHLHIKSMIPVLNTKLEIPSRTDIDGKLLLGATMFGVGWGLCGVCPGPALINIFAPTGGAMIWESRNGAFLAAMFAGTLLERVIKQHCQSTVAQQVKCQEDEPSTGSTIKGLSA